MTPQSSVEGRFVEDAFWIILGRAASPVELRDELRGFDDNRQRILLMRLLSSAEFDAIRGGWRSAPAFGDVPGREEGLRALGPDEAFVRRAYECLLGRPADDGGLQHYTQALGRGERRTSVLRSLTLSDEFDRRHRELAPQDGVLPYDTQLCELANPAKWDNPDWLAILKSLGLDPNKRSMHRKPYEFTQLIFGCRRLGVLRDDAKIVSVGAGHELVLYWLANHAGEVVATDMYEGTWQQEQGREGDPSVIKSPHEYAPFPYKRDRLVFMKMDGRQLAFADGTFDIAYSLSSIEHFGGMAGAAATMAEMARVLRPGGVLALATEYVLQGPPCPETFQPAEFVSLISHPDLELVAPLDTSVYRRYEYAAIDLVRNPYQTPHMVVRFNDTIFTTGMVFLRKKHGTGTNR